MHVDLWRLFGRRNCLALDSDFLQDVCNFLLIRASKTVPSASAKESLFSESSCFSCAFLWPVIFSDTTSAYDPAQIRCPSPATNVEHACSVLHGFQHSLVCQRHPGSMLTAQNRQYPRALEMHLVCRYAGQLVRIGFAWRRLGFGYGYFVALVVDFFVSSAD